VFLFQGWRFLVRAAMDPCFESISRGLSNARLNLNMSHEDRRPVAIEHV
jgi:hypothetical protein